MPHFPKPSFRKDRGRWYVELDGRQVNLGPDEAAAFARYHELMHELMSKPDRQLTSDSVAVVVDAFLDWVPLYRAPRSYDWYEERCQAFLDTIPATLAVGQLRPFHVQAWVDAKKWSDGMKRGAITAIQRAFNWAVKLGHINGSPIALMEKPPQGRREKIITPEMYVKIMGLVKDGRNPLSAPA